jgi:aminoglycoside phosphotransferase (APT) family kinase protein
MSNTDKVQINVSLVRRLIDTQFPQLADLLIKPVEFSGWDNRTFHLGDHMLVRMPSAADYAAQVEKEQRLLPKLAPLLPLPVPEPLAIGEPAEEYPWKWSINRWLPGDAATNAPITNLCDFAANLAQFLTALERIDSTGGPLRGGPLTPYDAETRSALSILKDKIDIDTATEVWETALATTWQGPAVWIHGDISTGNLLVQEGKLSAVIDFGQLAIGDPACDLAIAWTLFKGESREVFRSTLPLDAGTWARGRAWTLWKFLIVAAGLTEWNAMEASEPWRIIDEVLTDHKRG